MLRINTYQDSSGLWHANITRYNQILAQFPPTDPGYDTQAKAYQAAREYIDNRPKQPTGTTSKN